MNMSRRNGRKAKKIEAEQRLTRQDVEEQPLEENNQENADHTEADAGPSTWESAAMVREQDNTPTADLSTSSVAHEKQDLSTSQGKPQVEELTKASAEAVLKKVFAASIDVLASHAAASARLTSQPGLLQDMLKPCIPDMSLQQLRDVKDMDVNFGHGFYQKLKRLSQDLETASVVSGLSAENITAKNTLPLGFASSWGFSTLPKRSSSMSSLKDSSNKKQKRRRKSSQEKGHGEEREAEFDSVWEHVV